MKPLKRKIKMGLDNGIILKLEDNKLPEDFPTSIDKYSLEKVEKDGELEIAYWRKCWGIRAAIIGVLHMPANEYEHQVEADDVPAIRRELHKFLYPEYWEENADSIWEYNEYIEWMLDIMLNLKWLENYMKKHPNAYVYFYDSY